MVHFFVYSADDSKKLFRVRANYLRTSERSYLVLSENAMDCCILSYYLLARRCPLKIRGCRIFLLTQQIFFDIPTLDISQTVSPDPINHTIF